MYREHSVGVIVPAYNEEGFVGDVITEMPEYVDRMYVIDDCSTDETWEEIVSTAKIDDVDRVLAAQTDVAEESPSDDRSRVDHPKLPDEARTDGGSIAERASVYDVFGRVAAIKHDENRGAGGAIKTGYLAALADEIDLVATVDGDGQMDLSQMKRLLDPLVDGEADYAKGNRLLFEEFRRDMPKWRFFGNSILTFLTKIASGYWKTMDPQNGYTAITHRALANVGIDAMYEYYGYCNDLLVKLNARGMRVADVAMPAVYGDEHSSISYPQYIWNVSGMLLLNFFWRLKTKYMVLDFHPLSMFYIFGAILSGFGTIAIGWSLFGFFVLENQLFIRFMLSGLVFTIGSMFLMFAMLFDMQANEHREVQVYD